MSCKGVVHLKSPGSTIEASKIGAAKKSYGPEKSLSEDVKDAEALDLTITFAKGESQALPPTSLGSTPSSVKFIASSANVPSE